MGFYHKWKDRILSRTVPVIIVQDEKTFEITDMVKGSNHLLNPWTNKGCEIRTEPVQIINRGKAQPGYICSSHGVTVNVEEDIVIHPVGVESKRILVRFDGVIGQLISIDVIEKGLDLVGSNKKMLIGLAIGILLGWLVVAPLVGQMLK